MWSVFSSIFAGGDTTNKVVDGIIDGTDALFFTDEEKSRAGQKILDFKLAYAKATSGQNIARRFIAVAVTIVWFVLLITAIIAYATGFESFAGYLFKVMTDVVLQPFSIIIGFYFLAHMVRSIGEGKK